MYRRCCIIHLFIVYWKWERVIEVTLILLAIHGQSCKGIKEDVKWNARSARTYHIS